MTTWFGWKGIGISVLVLGCLGLASACTEGQGQTTAAHPNIILILADDMGYGDPASFNPASRIPTPNIDRLAQAGMRFTDAHAPGSWCTPTRYGLLTGRYPFREAMNQWTERAMIAPGQTTLASLLRENGYATTMVGKWHLGFDGGQSFDCTKPLTGGPVDHGFDDFFGIPASLDIPPYFYIEDDRCVTAPTDTIGDHQSEAEIWTSIQGAFWRGGGVAPSFHHEEVLTRLRDEAVARVQAHRRSQASQPLFLYLALTAPHTPWLPEAPFRGVSGAGLYGDFVAQVDDVVGRLLSTLEAQGMHDNTLVIFTSDNGPVWYAKDVERFGHEAAAGYRGMKGDAWEAGHRMPFVARWPGHIPAASVSDETISFTDLLATFAAMVDAPLPDGAGEDSYNILPALRDEDRAQPIRDVTIHSAISYLALRQSDWKLIPGLGSGGFSAPRERAPEVGEPEGQLYDLAADPAETTNLYDDHPEVVARLTDLLAQYKRHGHRRAEGTAADGQ